MSTAPADADKLRQIVAFLSAALERLKCVRPCGGGGGLGEAAAAVSSASDALKPQLVRMSIVLSAGPASSSTIDSFCSSSLPDVAAFVTAAAAILAGADDVVRAAVAPPCAAALQALHALYSGMLRVQEACDSDLSPALNNAALRALAACKVLRSQLHPVSCAPLTLPQGLPTSAAVIAGAALRRREGLARDVRRELSECLQSLQVGNADESGVDGATGQGASGCGGGGAGEEYFSVEDDMFTFTDEPCDASPAVVSASIQLCDLLSQGLSLCCGVLADSRDVADAAACSALMVSSEKALMNLEGMGAAVLGGGSDADVVAAMHTLSRSLQRTLSVAADVHAPCSAATRSINDAVTACISECVQIAGDDDVVAAGMRNSSM